LQDDATPVRAVEQMVEHFLYHDLEGAKENENKCTQWDG
jgi:hypothetical protein